MRSQVLADLNANLGEYKQRKFSNGKGDIKFDRIAGIGVGGGEQ